MFETFDDEKNIAGIPVLWINNLNVTSVAKMTKIVKTYVDDINVFTEQNEDKLTMVVTVGDGKTAEVLADKSASIYKKYMNTLGYHNLKEINMLLIDKEKNMMPVGTFPVCDIKFANYNRERAKGYILDTFGYDLKRFKHTIRMQPKSLNEYRLFLTASEQKVEKRDFTHARERTLKLLNEIEDISISPLNAWGDKKSHDMQKTSAEAQVLSR